MARTLIVASLVTMGGLLAAFILTAAAAYAVNAPCSEKMAWDGNC
jgi:hypothetical protein